MKEDEGEDEEDDDCWLSDQKEAKKSSPKDGTEDPFFSARRWMRSRYFLAKDRSSGEERRKGLRPREEEEVEKSSKS